MTTNTLILFASRYSVEVPLELDKWVPFKVKDFSSVICRTDPSRSTSTTTMSTQSTTIPITASEVTTETIPTNGTKEGNPKNESDEWKLFLLIVLSVIVISVIVLGIIILVVYYMNIKNKKPKKDINIILMPSDKTPRLRKSADLRTITSSTPSTVKTINEDI